MKMRKSFEVIVFCGVAALFAITTGFCYKMIMADPVQTSEAMGYEVVYENTSSNPEETSTTTVSETTAKTKSTTTETIKESEVQTSETTISSEAESVTNSAHVEENVVNTTKSQTIQTTQKTTTVTTTATVSQDTQPIVITTEELPVWLNAFPEEILKEVEAEKLANPGMELSIVWKPVSQSPEGFAYGWRREWEIPETMRRFSFADYVMQECEANSLDLTFELEEDDPWSMLETRQHTVAKCITRAIVDNSTEDFELLQRHFTNFGTYTPPPYMYPQIESQNLDDLVENFETLYYRGLWADTTYDEFLFNVLNSVKNDHLAKDIDVRENGFNGYENCVTYEIANINRNHFAAIFVYDASGKTHFETLDKLGVLIENYFRTDEGQALWKAKVYTEF